MPRSIEESANIVLRFLYDRPRKAGELVEGPDIISATNLSPDEVNDAVAILRDAGLLEGIDFLGTAPFDFGAVSITARGRHEVERAKQVTAAGAPPQMSVRAPTPVGSPYGFEDEHWELVTLRRGEIERLHVVLGYQFQSPHYASEVLRTNVEATFAKAVRAANSLPGARQAELTFRSLAAGYGSHLFNEIAADVIAADIAVFDVSDLNPNVMIEIGVALTWGTRVLLIKNEACAKPPSDISGHTWVDYQDSASRFPDPDHDAKLLRMVQRAVARKFRA